MFRRPPKTGESERAVQEAQCHLHEVQSRGEEVTAVARQLRIIRERNHFAERLHQTIIGHERGF